MIRDVEIVCRRYEILYEPPRSGGSQYKVAHKMMACFWWGFASKAMWPPATGSVPGKTLHHRGTENTEKVRVSV
jgi:hypothetical protein